MHTLHILTDLTPFNAWVTVGALGKHQDKLLANVHVAYLSARENPKFPLEHIDQTVVLTYNPDTDHDASLQADLKKYVAAHHIEHIHIHDSMSMRYVSGFRFLTKKKHLHFYRNERVFGQSYPFPGFTTVIHLTESSKNIFCARKPGYRQRSVVIPQGVDGQKYDQPVDESAKAAFFKEHAIPQDHFVIGHFAYLDQENDQVTLFKAFRKLVKKEMKGVLLVVGRGPMKEELQKLAVDFGIDGAVKFIAPQKDQYNLVRWCDAMASCSFQEFYSPMILEGMAAGLPVVVTAIGDNPDIVQDGQSGYVVPCGFPERMETALMKIYINKDLRVKLGAQAKQRIKDHHSMDGMVGEYEKLYK